MFATQSRRALAAWQALFDVRGDRAATVTVLRLAYADQAKEVAGKAFDFSSQSAEARWRAGHEAMTSRLEEYTSELQSLMRISYAAFCLTQITSITLTLY